MILFPLSFHAPWSSGDSSSFPQQSHSAQLYREPLPFDSQSYDIAQGCWVDATKPKGPLSSQESLLGCTSVVSLGDNTSSASSRSSRPHSALSQYSGVDHDSSSRPPSVASQYSDMVSHYSSNSYGSVPPSRPTTSMSLDSEEQIQRNVTGVYPPCGMLSDASQGEGDDMDLEAGYDPLDEYVPDQLSDMSEVDGQTKTLLDEASSAYIYIHHLYPSNVLIYFQKAPHTAKPIVLLAHKIDHRLTDTVRIAHNLILIFSSLYVVQTTTAPNTNTSLGNSQPFTSQDTMNNRISDVQNGRYSLLFCVKPM
jgi:hypothetical protein